MTKSFKKDLGLALPNDLREEVEAAIDDWHDGRKVERLWAKDPTLWTGRDEGKWLGWLEAPDANTVDLASLDGLTADLRREGFTHAVVLGMGGSSLCPEVWARTFGKIDGNPELHVLDSTDPAHVRSLEGRIDLARTLFVVSSKSGSTLEPNSFFAHFHDRVQREASPAEAGARFVAVTDPGSSLEKLATERGFRRVFHGIPSVGGRYSALTAFGMVPAAIMGLDPRALRATAYGMRRACSDSVSARENPGLVLGAFLGALAKRGRDKLTLVASPGIARFGAWLEQLVAESTGKNDLGIIPVDGEDVVSPERYGADRVFAYLRLSSAPEPAQDAAVETLVRSGQPVAWIDVREPVGIAAEFFRWEFATAVAGSILGINPFDQPDVEASKVAAKKLTQAWEEGGEFPAERPFLEEHGVRVFADAANADAMAGARDLAAAIRAHLARLRAGDYFGLLAYVEMCDAHEREAHAIRHLVRDAHRVATSVGFGPRFLHSTGQAYKGGPASGVFLQVTCEDADDLPVPGKRHTFGVIKAAQARGDLEVLEQRKRRAIRVHLGTDVAAGLAVLRRAVETAVR